MTVPPRIPNLATPTGRAHRTPRRFTVTRLRALTKLHTRLEKEAEFAPHIIDQHNRLEVEVELYRAAHAVERAIVALESGQSYLID